MEEKIEEPNVLSFVELVKVIMDYYSLKEGFDFETNSDITKELLEVVGDEDKKNSFIPSKVNSFIQKAFLKQLKKFS